MPYKYALLYYRNITPLHIGCGQAVGIVDLPIIRERSTGYPFIPGSGLRGSFRDHFRDAGNEQITALFGPDNDDNNQEDKYAGCISVHDARLLFFPVRANLDVFLWITCPMIIDRYSRDVTAFKVGTEVALGEIKNLADHSFVGPNRMADNADARLHLEEFAFSPAANNNDPQEKLLRFANRIGECVSEPNMGQRTVLLSNRSFFHFVNYATMLVQHNALTSAKTVKRGALFSLESLPPESIFYGIVGGTKQRKEAETADAGLLPEKSLAALKTGLLGENGEASVFMHFGGKESTGHGLTQVFWCN